ncbi:MAG: SRPBCC domain-containing protein [Acidimicrobiales bacterium]|nr:SRPBCC domain-containing protein [Acidimicrobiales bacterium]RZV43876.1 MAG: SRPBCC domain-containing protein [Acidimicrobiales bacterium]
MTDTDNSVVIERSFDAPVELIWQMWADPEHFKAWYGPMGASIPVANMDVRVGGKRHICMEMETPNGQMQMWFVGEFTAVDPHSKLSYTDAMSDADGNVMSPESMGMPANHPESTEVIVELEEADGGTKMTMTHVGVPAGSPGAMGWGMALDKLEAHVAAR